VLLPTRVFVGIAAVCGRAARVFEALAAGTLTRQQLRAGIARDWAAFRQEPEEVYRGLFQWEEQVLGAAIGDSGDLLLIGCGTGRELVALAGRGYRVVGLDPSAPALETARRLLAARDLPGTLILGFFEDTDVPGQFDAVIFTHRAYGLIQGRQRRVGALHKAATLIRPGGRIVVSYLRGTGSHAALQAAMRVGARLAASDWRVEPGDHLYATRSGGFGFEHHFSRDEFESEATDAGLRRVHAIDGECPAVVLEIADGAKQASCR
jgi:SAM-dependent methyltransferase